MDVQQSSVFQYGFSPSLNHLLKFGLNCYYSFGQKSYKNYQSNISFPWLISLLPLKMMKRVILVFSFLYAALKTDTLISYTHKVSGKFASKMISWDKLVSQAPSFSSTCLCTFEVQELNRCFKKLKNYRSLLITGQHMSPLCWSNHIVIV